MAILFAISVAAFFALIWAFIATARHIRRARRRRKLAATFVPTPPPTRLAHAVWSETISAPAILQEAPPPPPPPPALESFVPAQPLPIRFPLSSQRRAAESSTSHAIAAPLTAAVEPVAEIPTPISATIPGLAGERRPPVSVPTPNPDGRRNDWAYFNKDMGDLSDPAPSPRFKDRSRTR